MATGMLDRRLKESLEVLVGYRGDSSKKRAVRIEELDALRTNVSSVKQGASASIETERLARIEGDTAVTGLVTTLEADYEGTKATVTAQSGAIATLEDNAAATYSLKVNAGGAGAEFVIVATDDPTGPESSIRLKADRIDLVGAVTASSLNISDATNLYPDFDMVDPSYYSGSAVRTFINTGALGLGKKYMQLATDAALVDATSPWMAIQPSAEFLASGGAWLATAAVGAGRCRLVADLGTRGAGGVVTFTRLVVISDRTDSNTFAPQSASFTTTSAENMVRFRASRYAGGSQAGRTGGWRLMRKATTSIIGDLAVNTLQIAGNAVTLPLVALGADSTLTDTPQTIVTLSNLTDLDAVKSPTVVNFSTLCTMFPNGQFQTGWISVQISHEKRVGSVYTTVDNYAYSQMYYLTTAYTLGMAPFVISLVAPFAGITDPAANGERFSVRMHIGERNNSPAAPHLIYANYPNMVATAYKK